MMFDGLLPNVLAIFPVEWFSKIRWHISCWVSDNMGNFWAMIFFLFWEWVYHSEICCLMSGMFFLSINPSIRPFISSEDSFLFSASSNKLVSADLSKSKSENTSYWVATSYLLVWMSSFMRLTSLLPKRTIIIRNTAMIQNMSFNVGMSVIIQHIQRDIIVDEAMNKG